MDPFFRGSRGRPMRASRLLPLDFKHNRLVAEGLCRNMVDMKHRANGAAVFVEVVQQCRFLKGKKTAAVQ